MIGRVLILCVIATALVLGSSLTASATGSTVLNNSVLLLGVNNEGNLIVLNNSIPDASRDPPHHNHYLGLFYIPTINESLSWGTKCEGYGIADSINLISGWSGLTCNNDTNAGVHNIEVSEFNTDYLSAMSTVFIPNISQPTFKLIASFHSSPLTNNFYQIDISIQNVGITNTNLKYRRAMDWDVEPIYYNYISVYKGVSPYLIFTSNARWPSLNPLDSNLIDGGSECALLTDSFIDNNGSSACDSGALFDFDFGVLAPNSYHNFSLFYGATGNESEALRVLNLVGAEAYSLAESSTDPTSGTPNTFIFGYKSGNITIPDIWDSCIGICTTYAAKNGSDNLSNYITNTTINTTIYVTNMAYTDSINSTTNYDSSLGVVSDAYIYSNGLTPIRETYLELPENNTKLFMNIYTVPYENVTDVKIYETNTCFDEATLTRDNQPVIGGLLYTIPASEIVVNTWINFTVSSSSGCVVLKENSSNRTTDYPLSFKSDESDYESPPKRPYIINSTVYQNLRPNFTITNAAYIDSLNYTTNYDSSTNLTISYTSESIKFALLDLGEGSENDTVDVYFYLNSGIGNEALQGYNCSSFDSATVNWGNAPSCSILPFSFIVYNTTGWATIQTTNVRYLGIDAETLNNTYIWNSDNGIHPLYVDYANSIWNDWRYNNDCFSWSTACLNMSRAQNLTNDYGVIHIGFGSYISQPDINGSRPLAYQCDPAGYQENVSEPWCDFPGWS